MTDQGWLAEQFERSRPHLEAVAYGMLGSISEAQDAVQEAWLRLGRSDSAAIDDLRAWLTTVVGRISLDMLRSRKARHEYSVGSWLPEPLVDEPDDGGPEQQAMLADSIGLALLVVLESLTPAERLAFVLHDVFAVPFDDIAEVIDRSPDSARQLASRAGRPAAGPRCRVAAPGRRRLPGGGAGRRLRGTGAGPGPRCDLPHGHRADQPAGAPAIGRVRAGGPPCSRHCPAVREPGPARAGQRRGRRPVRHPRRPDSGDRVHHRGRPDRRAEPGRGPGQAAAPHNRTVNSGGPDVHSTKA